MEFMERLLRIALNEPAAAHTASLRVVNQLVLDAKTLAFVRIAATIAVGGSVGSFGAETDAAIAAGATNDEIVDVLDSVQPIVGGPRAVEAAGQLALALGYDLDEMP